MTKEGRYAPGWPGIPARWTSSAKTGVGTALNNRSRVWFTISHGILNEVYYPSIDQACIRDMGLLVTAEEDYFSQEKRDAHHELEWLAPGVPGFRLVNTCSDGRYSITKEVLTDPGRDTVLQKITFVALKGQVSGYRLYVLLAPHLGNHGAGNSAWTGDFDGARMLFAQRNGYSLAMASSAPLVRSSAGFVGSSDGWQDLNAHKHLMWEYTRAENGNVALIGEIGVGAVHGEFLLSLGFGTDPDMAAANALASLRDGFDKAKRDYFAGWQDWTQSQTSLEKTELGPKDLAHVSLAVLRTHESKADPGGLIASLSIPWGFSKGDDDLGGYHLVWSRDMVETAGGLLAAGAHEEVRRVLVYLESTQHADGHWPQNMWLDGSPYWDGIQMDETALPILLVSLAHREGVLAEADMAQLWPMVRCAAGYLARNGPVSPQDRWEEDPGYSPFTVGAEIAALLAAAELADLFHEAQVGVYLREIADVWHDCIDRWMYASGTDWASKYGVKGYYVRIAASATAGEVWRFENVVHVKNVAPADDSRVGYHLVSPDAFALVRFGLRDASDPRMCDTATVVDALLKVETPFGPTWHRYNDDGYGEHQDGAPFDGTGIGRGWPLLTGERAHFELAAGRIESARHLLASMEAFANAGGLIPEQVWDSPDIPDRELYFGRPSGSGMPLVWAHAEHLKLRRSLRDGLLFDLPPHTIQRYLRDKTTSPRMVWRFNHKVRSIPTHKVLRVETLAAAIVHWSADAWKTVHQDQTQDTGLGLYFVDLPTDRLAKKTNVNFTFFWTDAHCWEGRNFTVRMGESNSADEAATSSNEAHEG